MTGWRFALWLGAYRRAQAPRGALRCCRLARRRLFCLLTFARLAASRSSFHATLLDFLADAAASVSAFLASRTLIKKISDAALLSGKSMLATVSHLALL